MIVIVAYAMEGAMALQQLNSDNGALQGSLLNLDPQVNLPMYHPFFYAIRDDQAVELLFVGVPMNSNAG